MPVILQQSNYTFRSQWLKHRGYQLTCSLSLNLCCCTSMTQEATIKWPYDIDRALKCLHVTVVESRPAHDDSTVSSLSSTSNCERLSRILRKWPATSGYWPSGFPNDSLLSSSIADATVSTNWRLHTIVAICPTKLQQQEQTTLKTNKHFKIQSWTLVMSQRNTHFWIFNFTSVFVVVVFSQSTASSLASQSLSRLPSNFVTGHLSTMWFTVCLIPNSHSSDVAVPHLCWLGQHTRFAWSQGCRKSLLKT